MSSLVRAFVLLLLLVIASAKAATVSKNKHKWNKLFCTSQGGQVKWYALWNGAAPGHPPAVGVKISKSMEVCSIPWENKENNYLIPLDTLASVQPTLAVLAFQSRLTPIMPPGFSGNPSSLYCAQVGGTYATDTPSQFLPVPKSPTRLGWWTKLQDGSWYGINDFCIFADGSAIGTWALTYHAARDDMGNNIVFAYNGNTSPV